MGSISSCEFEYVDAADYNPSATNPYSAGHTAACTPADLGSATSDQSASADISSLTAGTTYHWRTVATNASGSTDGSDQTLPTNPALTIDSVSASNIISSSATLNALINPLGTDTTCEFEYGTDTSYSLGTLPCVPSDLGSGTSDVAASQQITGLSANTTYHYRVVATNSLGGVSSGDHTFIYDTTGQGLPDGRAYEMVSPVQKNGATLGETIFGLRPDVAADGSRVIITSIQCFADAGSCTATRNLQGSPYEFSRTSAGWVTTPLAPPASQFPSTSTPQAVSADAGTALFGPTLCSRG